MLDLLKETELQKRLLWINGALPALILCYDFATNHLGANPAEVIIRTTGVVAILFLALTLTVTPFAKLLKQNWLLKHRRWLGLWCFYYAGLHLLSYSVFDKGFDAAEILTDIKKRPFILLGFLGFLILVPLAITSNNLMIRRLGGVNWKRLHKLTYLVPPLVAVHYWLIVKSDVFYPAIFAFVLIVLLAYRAWHAAGDALRKHF